MRIATAVIPLCVGVIIGGIASSFDFRGLVLNLGHDASFAQLHRFGVVYNAIRQHYVDPTDERSLITAAISGMVASLDPHSGFLVGSGFESMRALGAGEYGEPGLQIGRATDRYLVQHVRRGSAAATAGVREGDVVESAAGVSLDALSAYEANRLLRGASGSSVRISLLRDGAPLEVSVARDVMSMRSVFWTPIGEGFAYIRIRQFTEGAADELKQTMSEIDRALGQALRGYVVDVRNNPGGLVDGAIAVANEFVDSGEIASTRGRIAATNRQFLARPGQNRSHGAPVVVLINGGTASAAEIFAGAMQDLHRAEIIGSRSFGKGSVQTTIPLGENLALHYTVALYYTPSGRSIQANGVRPDLEILQAPAAARLEKWSSEAGLPGHLTNTEGESYGSFHYVPPRFSDDKQLKAALAFLAHGAR